MSNLGGADFNMGVRKLTKQMNEIGDEKERIIPADAKYLISSKTRAEYSKVGNRIFESTGDAGFFGVFEKVNNKRYFYKLLASLRYYLAQDLFSKHVHEVIDAIPNIKDLDDIDQIYQRNLRFLSILRDFNKINHAKYKGENKKKKSKRQALAGLPKDWTLELANKAKSSKYYIEVLVSILTGCRPIELKNGIEVIRFYDEQSSCDCVAFDIKSAKLKTDEVKNVRRLVFSLNEPNEILNLLLDETGLIDEQDTFTALITSEVNFTVAVRRIAQELWPKHQKSVTAYCFRHQFSANLKKNGTSEFISAALGHTSQKTKKNYGLSSQGREGAIPLRVEQYSDTVLVRSFYNEYHPDYDDSPCIS
jgi:integrase